MAQIHIGHLQASSKAILKLSQLPQAADQALLHYALTRDLAQLLGWPYAP
jgi:hypothetical protein